MRPTCQHAYRFRTDTPGVYLCSQCHQRITDDAPKPAQALVMPPRLIEINETWWKTNAPWPSISFKLAKQYGWYVSMLPQGWYLIMPINDANDKPVFYSARRMDTMNTFEGKKYMYPEGVDKHVFIAGTIRAVVGITEGVADATFVSQVIPCIALLGNYYLDVLQKIVPKQTTMVTLFDGDAVGYGSAVAFAREAGLNGQKVRVGLMPAKDDPTDLTKTELRRLIKEALR